VGIGDGPITRLAFRIVRPRQPPAAGDALLGRYAAPGIAARLAGRGGVVELPDFLAGSRVVRRYEAAGARLAGAAGDDLALDHERRRRVLGELLVVLHPGLPADLAGARVERHQEAIGALEKDHVLEDREPLLPRGRGCAHEIGHVFRILARVVPDQVAVAG